jgi:signal transduction histidine kinase
MREFAGEVLDAQGIDYTIELPETMFELKMLSNGHYDFYLIFKEAINNIAKYSGATKVQANICRNNDHIYLNVYDNGIGFDLQKVNNGNGLKNMQKRAEKLGGNLTVNSAKNCGTSVILSIPLP